MRHQAQNRSDQDTFLLALGQLWAAGVEVDWTRGSALPTLISLPGYPFKRQRFWIEHNPNSGLAPAPPVSPRVRPITTARRPRGQQRLPDGGHLQRIWAQCLGITEIDRNANFFEVGGDSLVAISVAMAAARRAWTSLRRTSTRIRPRPRWRAVTARYAEGQPGAPDPGRRRAPAGAAERRLLPGTRPARRRQLAVPLVLQLRPDVGVDDIRAVLTAVANHHDALRLRLVDNAEPGISAWARPRSSPRWPPTRCRRASRRW